MMWAEAARLPPREGYFGEYGLPRDKATRDDYRSIVRASEMPTSVTKRVWCIDCQHFCQAQCASSCGSARHRHQLAEPAGAALFARVVRIVSQVSDPEEAALLSRESALKLGFDATQVWIEAQRLAAHRPKR